MQNIMALFISVMCTYVEKRDFCRESKVPYRGYFSRKKWHRMHILASWLVAW